MLCDSYFIPFIGKQGNPLAKNNKFATILLIVMAVLWFSWFFMSGSDPYRMNLPSWVRYFGLVVFIAGFLLIILSHTVFRFLAKRQETDKLVTTGIYSKIRNPM